MRIFVYALREGDERACLERFSRELGFEYEATNDYPAYDNLNYVKGFDGVSIITNPIDANMLDGLYDRGIKYLATRSIGYEHIDVAYAYKIGMRVSHVTYAPNSVANYAIMLMLIACRKIPYIMKAAENQDFSLDPNKLGKELSHCTVGVVGTGNIGECLVRHLYGFGCEILMYDPYEKKELKPLGRYVDLDTLYRESDIITLHAPATKDNYHMIRDEMIQKMKDGVIIVNTARGSLIDTSSLIVGLETGKVGFAALDTIEHEEGLYYLNRAGDILGRHRDRAILRSFPNVFMSPHTAFYTDEAVADMVGNSCKALQAFINGQDTPFEVPH